MALRVPFPPMSDERGRRRSRPLSIYLAVCPALVVAGVDAVLSARSDHVLRHGGLPVPPGTDLVLTEAAALEGGLRDAFTTYSRAAAASVPPGPRVVMLVHEPGGYEARRARQLGAVSVALSLDADDFVSALETAAHSETDAADQAPVAPAHNLRGEPLHLSARELEILGLICRGLTNDEIASELYLSVNSIKTYIRNAYRKVGVLRRAQAVSWGVQHGL